MQKRWLFSGIFLVLVIVMIGAVFLLAPNSSQIDFLNISNNSSPACLTNTDDSCLVMPSVTGLTSDSVGVSFPEQFDSEYHLVVMPFDREQQVLAVTWLPLFQELSADNEALQYWSIAALPELNTAIRFLVMTGLSAGIVDDEVRSQVTVLFLEQQDAFLEALGIDNDAIIQAFIMDNEGVVYYRAIGELTAENGADFREALNDLLAD